LLVDTHCHLDFDNFDEDRAAVLERARQAGLVRILNPSVDLPSSLAAVELASRVPEVYAAVGVHPNDVGNWDSASLNELRGVARLPKVIAIGEIGLDYYRERTPHDLQQRVLSLQLDLAAEMGLPVILHVRNALPEDRKAMSDMLHTLAEWSADLPRKAPSLVERPGIFHSFSDDLASARRAVEMNFRIGVTGPVTFKKSDILREVVAGIPIENLLIETDAPFLTPHPHRGSRNEPAYVRFIAEKIAQIRSLSLEEVAHVTTTNAERLFHWQVTL